MAAEQGLSTPFVEAFDGTAAQSARASRAAARPRSFYVALGMSVGTVALLAATVTLAALYANAATTSSHVPAASRMQFRGGARAGSAGYALSTDPARGLSQYTAFNADGSVRVHITIDANAHEVHVLEADGSCSVHPHLPSFGFVSFAAAGDSVSSIGSATVLGEQAKIYVGVRTDMSTFTYAVSEASGAVIAVRVRNEWIAVSSSAALPTAFEFARCASPTHHSRSLWHSIVNWGKCEVCKEGFDLAIKFLVDGTCTALTDGIAAEICNEGIELACEFAHCEDRICDALHMC